MSSCCIAGLSNSHIRPAGKAASVSLNWSCGDGGVEEVSTATGSRRDSSAPSRLCRSTMFDRWLRLQQQQQVSLHLLPSLFGDGGLVSAFEPRGSVIQITSLAAVQQLQPRRRNHNSDVRQQQAGRRTLPEGAAAVCGLPASCRFRGVA